MSFTTTTSVSDSHEIGLEGSLTVRTTSAEILVRGVDGPVATVTLRDGDLAEEYAVDKGLGRLDLRPLHQGIFDLRHEPGPLELAVPTGTRMRIESTGGTIRVLDVVGSAALRTVSGDVELVGVGGEQTAETVSGDVKIRAGVALAIGTRTVSGDIDVAVPAVSRAVMKTTSGDVRISGQLMGEGPFSIESVSGDADLQLDGPARIEITTFSGDIIDGSADLFSGGKGRRSMVAGDGPTIRVRTLSGDVRLPIAAPRGHGPTAPAAAPAPVMSEASTVMPIDASPAGSVAEPPPPQAAPAFEPHQSVEQADDDPELGVLRDLEAGRIDLIEAERRLATMERSSRVRIA